MEVWGAQGINQGGGLYGESPCTPGKGGYSYGDINIEKNKNLYICIGGQPYNGGGINGFPGGGATHIASSNRGELKNYASYKSDIYIVAGGGGGAEWGNTLGGSGGGTTGGNSNKPTYNNGQYQVSVATGGSQTSGGKTALHNTQTPTLIVDGSFGQGGYACHGNDYGPGGGGGWYGGGGCAYTGAAAGGSGHINTTYLTNYNMQNGVREGLGYCLITWKPIL